MSKHGQIDQDWADGTYSFRLGLKELEAVETRFDKSIFVIADDLRHRRATSSMIYHVIREALIGGGTKPVDALALVRKYVDEYPLEENRDVAYVICLAGLMRVHGSKVDGSDGDEDPKPEAANQSG